VRRTVLTIVLVTLAVLLPAQAANAGGNWLGFRSEEPVAGTRNLGTWAVMHVGQEVVAHTGLYVMNPHRMGRLETEGPFYAWLSPGDAYLDDANLPADAIRLAPFTIAFDGSNGVPVRARFTVPSVPSGEYEVVVCNDPCTLSGFGEFVQGWITITQTSEEARLMNLARERKWSLREAKKEARQLEGDVGSLEADLDAALGEARVAAVGLRSTDRAIELLESENDALRALLAAADGDGMPAWVFAALGFAILGAAFVVRRRRAPAFEIPDTVPDDLVDRDHAGV
jgi:MYXO-CTERM domain-containing protein